MVQQFPRLRSQNNAGIFAAHGQDFFERVRSVIKLRADALPIFAIAVRLEIKILRELPLAFGEPVFETKKTFCFEN